MSTDEEDFMASICNVFEHNPNTAQFCDFLPEDFMSTGDWFEPLTEEIAKPKPQEGIAMTDSSAYRVGMQPTPNCAYGKMGIYSDAVALKESTLYKGIETESERIDRFCAVTGRSVQLIDGTTAYARGSRPSEQRNDYKFAPASNPDYKFDITIMAPSKSSLIECSSANLPLALAWIDDVRTPLPHPKHLTAPILCTDGKPEIGINGEKLRDFNFLPRYISSAVEGWRLFFWFTFDSRINFFDIIARMHFKCNNDGGDGPLSGGVKQTVKMLQTRIDTFRRKHGILAPLNTPFDHESYEVTVREAQAIKRFSQTQLDYGTWWIVDEERGVMYPPPPEDENTPYDCHQYILPLKLGMSPRVRKILEECDPDPQQVQIMAPHPRISSSPAPIHRSTVSPPPRTTSEVPTQEVMITPMSTPSPSAPSMSSLSSTPQGRKRTASKTSSSSKPKRARSDSVSTPPSSNCLDGLGSSNLPVNNTMMFMPVVDAHSAAGLGDYGAQRQEAALRKYMEAQVTVDTQKKQPVT